MLFCSAFAGFSTFASASPIVAKKNFSQQCTYNDGPAIWSGGRYVQPMFRGWARGEIFYRANGNREVHVNGYNIFKDHVVGGNSANLNLIWANTKAKSADNLKQGQNFADVHPVTVSISAYTTGNVTLEFIFDKSGKPDPKCTATIQL